MDRIRIRGGRQLKGEIRRDWLNSSVPGVDYTANLFLLGVRWQE